MSLETLADIPRHHAKERPDAVALVFEQRATSFAALDRDSNRFARALIARGLRPGGRVAVLAKDSDLGYALMFGIAKAGGVIVPVSWRLAPPEILGVLADSGAELLFLGPDFARGVEAARAQLPALREVVTDWPAFLHGVAGEDPRLAIGAEDPAVQIYTSGTTGRPKGVILAHRSFFAVVRSTLAAGHPWIGLGPEDVVLHTLPSTHIGGLWWAMTGLAHGAKSVVMDAFVAWRALELIAAHRVTKFCLVPAMIQMVLAEPSLKRTDLSSITHLMYGGAPIATAVLERALATFGRGLFQVYGLTETGNMAVWLPPEDHSELSQPKLQSAGRPYPGVRIEVVDREGQVQPAGEIGEIRIRTPAVMLGYHGRPEETAKVLRDGWLYTGDAGHLDAEGYVYISDRVKDMIIYAGHNVYPAEVENALYAHPAVAEAAVIGIPDERWGELVKAIVVKKAEVEPAALLAHLRGRIAEYKLPKSIDFAATLPRTASGKVKKDELRAPYWAGRARRVN